MMMWMTPVSYTHLDSPQGDKPEKGPEPRTGRPAKADKAARGKSPSPALDKVSRGKEPVSYTHLDVYKRQILDKTMTLRYHECNGYN